MERIKNPLLGIRLETKEEPADLAELKTAFDKYHTEVKAAAKTTADKIADLEKKLAAEVKEREGLETRANKLGLGGGSKGELDQVELKEVGSALRSYIKSGSTAEIKSMLESSDPEGGYTVYPTLSSQMTKKIFETSPMRQLARVMTIGTDAFEELLDLNEPDAGWVGETEGRPETDTPDLGKLRIPAREVYANPKVTQNLLDDSSIDIGAWLVDKMSTKFRRLETTAFYSGDGLKRPRGFLTYATAATSDATRPWGTLQYVPTGHASAFITPTTSASPADCLVDLLSSLKAEYRTNAWWQMNKATAGTVRKFKDGEGRFIWQDSLQQGLPPMLLGYPVALAEDMEDVGAGAYPIAFGDWRSGYTIVDRLGEKLLRDPYTAKPHVHFYMYRRVGGDVNNFDAIKLLKVATS
ncbi:phage major capsid protein [Mesorhizobium sp. M4B.F.Ca.ET.013.02.1.1]|uniref:phage major capsid protein n=1 Tax=Mesorhizobium sp. M4B.F.Ca.ET.013.02.1.1 TaxID=2496755 RepID=UPI000FD1B3C0|nr:phage major capsid protein [Mesorhizobium sp. M4B.F.Ca.ET.013.02.1.1]RUW26942.1 phage major capsid protein [Mesorhizobium sp. M4B.F.Ca.ET.013.02.1.1]